MPTRPPASSPSALPRVAGAILLAGVLVLGLACTEPASRSPAPLLEVASELVHDGPVLVTPGSRWDRHDESGLWRFRTFGRILCVVREPVTEPLRLRLHPDAETADFAFQLYWGRTELEPGALRRDGGVFEVEVPAERLTPGHHELVLRRRHRPGVPFAQARHDNLFTEIGWRLGDRGRTLTPDDAPRQALLAELILHGVLGRDQERRGGILFVGAGEHTLELRDAGTADAPAPEEPVSAHFEPENHSAAPATFRLAAGDREARAEVAAGERGTLELEIPAGTAALELAVEGEPEGPYLWGMPILQPLRDGGDRSPVPVILVTLDTTRRDALGVYGAPEGVTPVLDRLAERSTVYERAFSTSPWTLPSHASIFTGLYPSKHGAGVSEVQLAPGTETLARRLQRRGYLTAGFSSGELSSSRFGLAQGFHHYRNPDRFETLGGDLAGYLDDFLDRYGEHPLFLFVNYFDPHAVYRAPEEFEKRLGVAERAAKIDQLPGWKRLLGGEMSAWRAAVEGEAPITPEVRDYLRAAYLAEVAYADHLLGRLFARLEAFGIFDRALVVVTADHGELLGEGGYVSHAARLDPELVEIPLIVKWPGQEKGERIDDLVSLVDLFPTILEVAGLEPPPSDGRGLREPDAGEPRTLVLLEEHESLVHPLPKNMKVARHLFGVQRPSFRQLVWDADQECARLESGSWNEAPCTAERERVLQSIQAVLGVLEHPSGDPDEPVSEELRESLEALGYL